MRGKDAAVCCGCDLEAKAQKIFPQSSFGEEVSLGRRKRGFLAGNRGSFL